MHTKNKRRPGDIHNLSNAIQDCGSDDGSSSHQEKGTVFRACFHTVHCALLKGQDKATLEEAMEKTSKDFLMTLFALSTMSLLISVTFVASPIIESSVAPARTQISVAVNVEPPKIFASRVS